MREGAVDCPLCGRQIAAPTEQLVAFGVVEQLTPETADAVECPACDGVTFVDDAPAADGDRGEVNGVDVKRDDAVRDDAPRDDANEGD